MYAWTAGSGVIPALTASVMVTDFERTPCFALFFANRVDRYQHGRLTHRVPLPAELAGRRPILAPDACAVLYPVGGAIVRVPPTRAPLCRSLPGGGIAVIPFCSPASRPAGPRRGVVDRTASGSRPWTGTTSRSFRYAKGSSPLRWPVRARRLVWLG